MRTLLVGTAVDVSSVSELSLRRTVDDQWQDDAALGAPLVVVRPLPRWPGLQLGEIWLYRDLLLALTVRDIRLRYRQTALGVAWVVLQPLLAAAVFGFVFGRVAKLPSDGTSHFVLAFLGVVTWSAFSAALIRSALSVVQNVTLVSRIFFPRTLLPMSAACASLVDGLIGLLLASAVALASGGGRGLAILAAPLWVLAAALLGLGAGLAAAALMVSYRDVQHVLPFVVQMTLFASPVAYPVSAVPHSYRFLFHLNPLSGLIEGLRWSLLGLPPSSWPAVMYAVVMVVLVFLSGVLFFRTLERGFADVI